MILDSDVYPRFGDRKTAQEKFPVGSVVSLTDAGGFGGTHVVTGYGRYRDGKIKVKFRPESGNKFKTSGNVTLDDFQVFGRFARAYGMKPKIRVVKPDES